MPIPDAIEDDVIDLGFVPIEDKRDSYSAATLLCQPSVMESFSIVMMESWLAGRPVLVNADCDVTAEHTKASGGGFAFSDYESFREAVVKLSRDEELALKMGLAGQEYVNSYYVWPKVTDRFMELFESFEMAAGQAATV
jgi:glycosyltransferase involved in cell wall biosynthesis